MQSCVDLCVACTFCFPLPSSVLARYCSSSPQLHTLNSSHPLSIVIQNITCHSTKKWLKGFFNFTFITVPFVLPYIITGKPCLSMLVYTLIHSYTVMQRSLYYGPLFFLSVVGPLEKNHYTVSIWAFLWFSLLFGCGPFIYLFIF